MHLALFSRGGCCDHLLFVGRDAIRGISRVVVHFHIQEGEILWHFDESNGVHEG